MSSKVDYVEANVEMRQDQIENLMTKAKMKLDYFNKHS